MNLSPEEFEDAVAFAIYNRLEVALQVQRDRYADADMAAERVVELVMPAWENFYPGGVAALTVHPAIEVAVPDMGISDFDVAVRDGDVTFSLIIRHWHQHAIYDVLHRQTARMSAAILDTLTGPNALPGCRVTAIRGAWRANPETREHDEIKSGAVLGLTVETTMIR